MVPSKLIALDPHKPLPDLSRAVVILQEADSEFCGVSHLTSQLYNRGFQTKGYEL